MHIQTPIKYIISISVMLSMFALSACGSAPKREPYSGADQVGEIEAAQLVGNWNIVILNPVSGEEKTTVTTEYRNDGTWTSTVIPPEEQNADLGPMRFAGEGSWQVNGDSLFAKTDSIKETTGHNLGGLMESVMTLFMSKMSGTVNPYEITQDRMIFVNEENGQATMLERI